VILCTESAFAGIFSFLFWHETVTLKALCGFIMILAGVLITELSPSALHQTSTSTSQT